MFIWTPSLALGVPWIDAQHQTLFERAAKFEAAFRAGEPGYRLEELFAFLAEYAMEHFEAEERYMREVGYPQLGEHIQEHREFMRRFSSLVPQWNSEGESSGLLNALLEFLNSWLTEHVSKSDQRIGDFVWNPKA
jgi:hemerythrin